MDLVTPGSAVAYPLLRKLSVASQYVLAGYFLLNGVGHQLHVLWKAHHGTLKPGASAPALLLVGAGLLAIGTAASLAVPWVRAGGVAGAVAQSGVVLLAAAVIGAIWSVYGPTFLVGSTFFTATAAVILVLDLIANRLSLR